MFGSRERAPEKSASGLHWAVLVASAVLEAVWAISLEASRGFSVPLPTVVFLVASTLSLFGLAYAMRGIPLSVAYAVWTGLGAALTVSAAMAFGGETVSPVKLLLIAGIVGCVIGLRFAKDPSPQGRKDSSARSPRE